MVENVILTYIIAAFGIFGASLIRVSLWGART